MTSRRQLHPAFVTEPTETPSTSYSHGASRVCQRNAPANLRGLSDNKEENAVTTQAFEPRNLFLTALPPADLTRLRGLVSYQHLPQGMVLQEPDQQVEQVLFIDSGMISLVATMQNGAAIETATLGREAVLGALSALGTHRASTRAIVQIGGGVWKMSAADFRAAVEASPNLRRVTLLSSELTLAQMQQTAACNALHSAEKRLCRWIAQVRDRIDDDVIRLTHDFLAQMLAVRRPTVSLIAYELQQAGFIRYHRGKITIVDRKGLERGACECLEALRDKTKNIIQEVS